ncbi:MAG: carbamoyl-phosphate synthase large subunit [Bacteroidetes bacterium]|nr:carbamoyl-phosphate synthase large subunit [Bacteroidota bacterium]
MPINFKNKKVFLIGSGPIIVGQACEFDYAGTQACKALKEEGCKIILVNSNPATIMTDITLSDVTYIEPLRLNILEDIIKKERPDYILPTLGGQIALNKTIELKEKGILDNYKVKIIGASYETIRKAEDRFLFRKLIDNIGLKTPINFDIKSIEEIDETKNEIIFPVIIRSSFSLGGTGCEYANNLEELKHKYINLQSKLPKNTIQIEQSLVGWKEFEMEAVRDRKGNCIIVCCIENIDSMGIHTGDSITVAPSQTLSDKEYQKMRRATFKVLEAVGIETGGANVQFAVNPINGEMLVIEMNPRVSRSSALASKATGYPIAKIATKLALGYTLDELTYDLLGNCNISAAFEPTLDYVVTKIPKFNIEKFPEVSPKLGVKMKSIGEAMAIGRNFQESLLKAIESLEVENFNIAKNLSNEILLKNIEENNYLRIFYIFEAFRRNIDLDIITKKSLIDFWFINQISEIIELEKHILATNVSQSKLQSVMASESLKKENLRTRIFTLAEEKFNPSHFPKLIRYAKRQGFSDKYLSDILNVAEENILKYRNTNKIKAIYKKVDRCASEFKTHSCYYYSTYDDECEAKITNTKKVLIIGSGPNRIGQGIEFDYNCVHAAAASKERGYEVIIANSNPETVSTDYDVSDKLYFEPLTLEYISNIIDKEKPEKVFYQFGGQTALNIALSLKNHSSFYLDIANIELCENREKFKNLVLSLDLNIPKSIVINNENEIIKLSTLSLCFPLIVRPSYIISGSKMKVINNQNDLEIFFKKSIDKDIFPILVEEFLTNAKEIEVEGVSDGNDIFIAGIIEQIEPAGVHSGDSNCIYPSQTLSDELIKSIRNTTIKLLRKIKLKGLFNLQLAIKNEIIYIIELNPRASRAVPYLSKILNVSLAKVATKCLLGIDLKSQKINLFQNKNYVAIKKPVFSKILIQNNKKDISPEMYSTGEVMSIGCDFKESLKKLEDVNYVNIISLQDLQKV